MKKLAESTKNSLILLDTIFAYCSSSQSLELFNILKHLAENNQVILTTNQPLPDDINLDYQKIELSRDHFLNQYLVDTIRGNSKFYNSFVDNIKNIEKLMGISIIQTELQETQNKMLFLNVVISMETYLSDAFINTVVNSKELIMKLLEKSTDFQKRKFKTAELIKWVNKLEQSAEEYLLNITYHNIWRVKKMYKEVLNVDFPEDLEEIQKAIMIRHDLVHRNGKTMEGTEIKIKKEDITQILEQVKNFIKFIEDQIIRGSQE